LKTQRPIEENRVRPKKDVRRNHWLLCYVDLTTC